MAKLRLNIVCRNETFNYQGDHSAVKIGRSLKCEFNIPKDDLSREHCLLESIGEHFFITDLGSKNGLSINGKMITPNEKTPVNEESTIVLSNIYYLKINPIEVKTKADMILKKINPEIDTRTFQLELEDEKDIQPVKLPKKIPRKAKTVAVALEKPQNENLKMLIAFVLILGFALYQALGR